MQQRTASTLEQFSDGCFKAGTAEKAGFAVMQHLSRYQVPDRFLTADGAAS